MFAKAFATMNIEQSPERNEQAFEALKQANPNSESFLDANKTEILKIIETAHNKRNRRDESKDPLRTDPTNSDNKLYPMMEEDFTAEKNYILTEVGKLLEIAKLP